jgi:hypothetical protein
VGHEKYKIHLPESKQLVWLLRWDLLKRVTHLILFRLSSFKHIFFSLSRRNLTATYGISTAYSHTTGKSGGLSACCRESEFSRPRQSVCTMSIFPRPCPPHFGILMFIHNECNVHGLYRAECAYPSWLARIRSKLLC